MKKSKALVHIPKTGGTTFARTLKWIYEPWRYFRYNPEDPSRTCKVSDKSNDKYFNNFVLMSHSYFGIHKYVKKDIDYITIIRNPIRRYISRYYHLKIHYPESKGASMKLEEFCKSSHGWSKGNRLVSYISGMDAETNFTSALSKAKENLERNLMQAFFFFSGDSTGQDLRSIYLGCGVILGLDLRIFPRMSLVESRA